MLPTRWKRNDHPSDDEDLRIPANQRSVRRDPCLLPGAPEQAQAIAHDPCLTTVAIIGAGPLGRWLALAAARAGYRVLLEDVMPANLHHAEEYLRQQLDAEMLASSGSPVQFVSTVEDAVREADLAIDCVPDELESKLEILWLMDRMAPPRTVLATPTTRLSISDLAGCTYRAEQCMGIGVDPRDFSHLQKPGGASALTLRTTEKTTPETTELVRTFWERLGFAVTLECG
jgi:3-hydroxybutyryl-CoA dehydrogenase